MYILLKKAIKGLTPTNNNLYVLSFVDERLWYREYNDYMRIINEDIERKLKK